MTVSSEAKRTLVKSPPELWSEVSDPQSLARHLDGLEQIRITRVEPETAVEWEAEGASGSVRLQPSGFGTKVTLSLSRELPPSEPIAAEREPAGDPACEPETDVEADPGFEADPGLKAQAGLVADARPEEAQAGLEAEAAPLVADAGPETELEVEVEAEPIAAEPDPVESEPTPESSGPAPVVETPRRGFFARLFKRRPTQAPLVQATEPESESQAPVEPEPATFSEPEPESEPADEGPTEPEAIEQPDEAVEATSELLPEPAEVTVEAEQGVSCESEPAPEPGHSPGCGVAADLATLEAEMAEQDEAMLTAMLDRLGAAHHRPFSRS